MHHGVSCFYSLWMTIYKVILDLSGVSATMPLKCSWCDCRVKVQKIVFVCNGGRTSRCRCFCVCLGVRCAAPVINLGKDLLRHGVTNT